MKFVHGIDASFDLQRAGDTRRVELAGFVTPEDRERAATEANAWIKRLRELEVDGRTLRDRFTCRGDSCWWFAELYLHKEQVIQDVFLAAFALQRLAQAEQPSRVRLIRGTPTVRCLAPAFFQARGVSCAGARWTRLEQALIALRLRAKGIVLTMTERWRQRRAAPMATVERGAVAVFVHAAFVGSRNLDDRYIGHILDGLAASGGPPLHAVTLGPPEGFRRRTLRRRVSGLVEHGAVPTTSIEAAAAGSRVPVSPYWKERHAVWRALAASRALRAHAVIEGCDAWALVRQQLLGLAWLQFPWSASAMDQAAATLDRLQPAAAVTYAEAGGWGRALALECRRRGIPFVGIQHGFIYRHWLNYLHEEDEVRSSPGNAGDRGFPFPTMTLVYDEFTRRHLTAAGHFPPTQVATVGSSRLDELVAVTAGLTDRDRAETRRAIGAGPEQPVVVVAAKFTQVASSLPSLAAAVRQLPGVCTVVKCHPADRASDYETALAGTPDTVVLPAGFDLARLLGVARAVVTVNSTVAVEAMACGVPALVMDLPNNLSPFVDAGVMVGATAGTLAERLAWLLEESEGRLALLARAGAFLADQGFIVDGRSTARAVAAIRALAQPGSDAP